VGLGMILWLAVTMFLIADVDRPLEGFIRVNADAMTELQNTMNVQGQ
jgi:hypothetical protein